MKTFTRNALCVLAGALIWSLAAHLLPGATRAQSTPPNVPLTPLCDAARTVQVSGAATVNVTPDRALVRLGVVSTDTTIAGVERANTAAIQAVRQALVDMGVEARDIATDIYVVEPVYKDWDALVISGYRIQNEVAVTVREVDQTSALVSAALGAGANQVRDVAFYTSELRRYRDQARELALTAAAEKARDLAEAAGAQVGCVMAVTENSWSYYSGWYGRGAGMMSQNVVQNAAPGGEAGGTGEEPLSLGQIAVRAEVNAAYSLQ